MRVMLPTTVQVALGGALGATLRYGLGAQLARPGFPVAVLTANVAGSFLMGLGMVWLVRAGAEGWQPFLLVGVLGGFTTFSAFSFETVALIERGHWAQAAAYVLLSVGLGVAALAGAMALVRALP